MSVAIQIDEPQYEAMKARREASGVPIAVQVRRAVAAWLGADSAPIVATRSSGPVVNRPRLHEVSPPVEGEGGRVCKRSWCRHVEGTPDNHKCTKGHLYD